MSKSKTHKASVGRFSVTGTGKVKCNRPGLRHLLTGKSSKRKRHLASPLILNKSWGKIYSKLLGRA